jgi:hypothetical protein
MGVSTTDASPVARRTLMDGASAGQVASLDLAVHGAVESGLITFNARIACDPGELEVLVRIAVDVADNAAGARSTVTRGRAFRPSYPQPVHRLLN